MEKESAELNIGVKEMKEKERKDKSWIDVIRRRERISES